jgi:peptide/nickel transport system substrate-binding protein
MKVKALISKAAAIILAASLLLLPACDAQGGTSDYKIASYTIADSTGDWGYPSPYAHYSRGPGYVRMQFIFETLVWKDEDEFVPQLATEWQYNESDNSYTFELREDVKWHDGTAFTADDVVFTFNYVKEHPYQWVDNSIVESVEALDTYTVKLYLSQPYAPFFQDVAGSQPILPKHIWEDVTEPGQFQQAEAAIGTGPYKLADYNKEQGTYLYTANDDYYLGTPLAGEIKFVKISAEMTMAALEDGTVNAAAVTAEMTEGLQAQDFTIIEAPVSWNAKLTINHRIEPYSSKEFRQTLAYAIDREALVDIVLRGEAVPGSPGIVPPTSVWYNPDTPQFEYNTAKAIELLGGLGYQLVDGVMTKDGEPLVLNMIGAVDYKDLGQFIVQQLALIGIQVDFQTMEGKTVDSKVEAWDFELSLYGHGGLYEPSFLINCITGEGFNSARYHEDAELTGLLEQELAEMDTAARESLVMQIQALYAEDMPAITLYYPKSYWAHDGSLDLSFTMDGISIGVPIPLNRMCFVGQ